MPFIFGRCLCCAYAVYAAAAPATVYYGMQWAQCAEAALLALVLQWQREGRTVITVLHDDAQVRTYFPQTLLLARECIAWGPTAQVLTDANLQRARAMAEAWDETAAICDIDGTLNGLDFDALLEKNLAQSLATAQTTQTATA